MKNNLKEDIFPLDLVQLKEDLGATVDLYQKFKYLLEGLDSVFWLVDLKDKGRIIYVSPAFQKIWGYNPSELYQNPHLWSDCIVAEDRKDFFAAQLSFESGKSRDFDATFRIKRKDGKIRWINSKGKHIGRNGQRSFLIGGIATDITLGVEAELRLKYFNSIVENSNDGIYSKDLRGIITTWNNAAEKIYGFSKKEMIGSSVKKIIHSKYDDSKKILTTIKKGIVIKTYNTIRKRKDGSLIHVSLSASPIYDTKNNIIGVSVIARDITEKKSAEEELAILAARVKLATESAKIGVWDWDIIAGKLIFDDLMYTIYGLRKGEFTLTYERWRKTVHPEDLPLVEKELKLAMAGKKNFDTAFRVIWKDRTIHLTKAYGTIIRDKKGKPVKMIGVTWLVGGEK